MAQASMVGVYHQLATRFLVLLVETTEHRQRCDWDSLGPQDNMLANRSCWPTATISQLSWDNSGTCCDPSRSPSM